MKKSYNTFVTWLKKNKLFVSLMFFIFILHILTFPSIHHIIDEYLYLDVSRKICEGNLTYFSVEQDAPVHPPLYHALLCLTSPLHQFNIDRAGVVSFIFLIALVVGWYRYTPFLSETTRKRMALLLFANSLLWVYSSRVLIEVPLAFFSSLGMLHLYLFFKNRVKKNYYLGILFLALGILTKESTLIFFPIFVIYLLLIDLKNVKKLYLLLPPLIPYIIFILYQHATGYPVFKQYEIILRATTYISYSFIPYANLPTFVYLIGVFGLGIISCILIFRNRQKVTKEVKDYLYFFLVLYLVWEITYDFITFGNVPRYHTTLMPFFTVLIAESSRINKKLMFIYIFTLIYSLILGFMIAYFFHVETMPVWEVLPQTIYDSLLSLREFFQSFITSYA